jgi:hypothetical protein
MAAKTMVATVKIARTIAEARISESLRIRWFATSRELSTPCWTNSLTRGWSKSDAMNHNGNNELSLLFISAYEIINGNWMKRYNKLNYVSGFL